MVTVINRQPHPEVVKQTPCRNCGVTLEYVPIDVKRDFSSDYLGDKDYYSYIDCPNCGKQVRVK